MNTPASSRAVAGRAANTGLPRMRQLMFTGPGRVGWAEVPAPRLRDGNSALVRPLAVARCDLDLRMATEALFPGPYPVGHEAVAEVIDIGEAVRRHRPGDRVLVPFQVSCGACPACLTRRYAACHTYRAPAGAAFGFGKAGGGHGGAVSDLLAVPCADHLLITAPASVPAEVLCTLPDNAVDGYRSVAPHLKARPGADVLVVGGAGPSIGLYAVAAAAALGASAVRYVDSDEKRCGIAERLGAAAVHHEGPWPRRFPRAAITVSNTHDPQGLATTLRSTDDYGTCTSTAIFFGRQPSLPLLELYTKGITVHLSRADSRLYTPEVADLAASGRLRTQAVTTRVAGWEDAPAAWLVPATKLVLVRN
jgi:threonine dehydrogenase-like Zn-dependent dehydrogenase